MNENTETAGKPSIFAPDESATPVDESTPEAAAAEASAPVRNLANDLLSVFLAATAPLTLHAIQDELNAPGRGAHVPTGPIDHLLDTWTDSATPRVQVIKLGDPVVEHYQLTPNYRDELEKPGLVIERRALILSAFCDGDEEDGPVDEGEVAPTVDGIMAMMDSIHPREKPFDRAIIAMDLLRLIDAGLVTYYGDVLVDIFAQRFALEGQVYEKIIEAGSFAVAKTTLPQPEEPPAPVDASAEEKRQLVESYVVRLNEKLDEQTRRAKHFQSEAMRYAQQAARYEVWAKRGGFSIAEIVGASALSEGPSGPGVPWSPFRLVDYDELRRLVREKEALDESLGAAKKNFDSAKSAYAAIKAKLEEKLALVEQAQRSPSYIPDKMVHRIAREGRIEVVSADDHDRGDHLDWEDPPPRAREPEPVVVSEPAPPVPPAQPPPVQPKPVEAPKDVGVALAGAGVAITDERPTKGTQATVVPLPEPAKAEGPKYAGVLNVKALGEPIVAVFLNEEFGVREPDVMARFEAIHGTLPDGAAKVFGPALRYLTGKGDLLTGPMPGETPTSDPVQLYWHKSFKDPRSAPPPAQAEVVPSTRRGKGAKAKTEDAPAEGDDGAKGEPKAGKKATKKAAAK